MATAIPDLTEAQLNTLISQGEARVYRSLRDNLPNDYVVLFQVGWIVRREGEQARDGEIDFLICHPNEGCLCVEVKGGGVGFDAATGEWFSIDRHGHKHKIKNPINQALKAKYSILSKLDEHPRWRALSPGKVLLGHAVFFPDIGDATAPSRADLPAALVGTATDLQNPREWIDSAFAYWGGNAQNVTAPGRRGIDVIREVFARSFEAAPLVATRLAEQEARRLVLTQDQVRVLDFVRAHRRVAVRGGAGTGKTVLALEKARRLADEGFRTLLTCYNRKLADYLASLCASTANLDVMGFHQLCHRQVQRARRESGRDLVEEAKFTYPGADLYDVQLPNALAYSLEVLPERYEAIICDEGQDFREDFWVALELLLADYDRSPFYVFYDDNQNIYARASTFPIQGEPFSLTTNCRNTAPIHAAAYTRYRGVPVSPPDNEGAELQFDRAASRAAQAGRINARIVDLIARHGVSPGDIVVLIVDAVRKADCYAALRRLPLPRPATWREEGVRNDYTVLMDTVGRFKGLEAPVVILWGLDGVHWKRSEELLYVGMSRAKSLLVVVGTSATCAMAKSECSVASGRTGTTGTTGGAGSTLTARQGGP